LQEEDVRVEAREVDPYCALGVRIAGWAGHLRRQADSAIVDAGGAPAATGLEGLLTGFSPCTNNGLVDLRPKAGHRTGGRSRASGPWERHEQRPHRIPTGRAFTLGVVLLAFLVLSNSAVSAVQRTSPTNGLVQITGDRVDFSLTVPVRGLALATGFAADPDRLEPESVLQGQRDALINYVAQRIGVQAQGQDCLLKSRSIDLSSLPETILFSLVFRCPSRIDRLTVRYGLLFEIDPDHRALGRIVLPDGEREYLLDSSMSVADFDVAASSPGSTGWQDLFVVFRLGIDHILIGYDHLAFLFALVIVATRFATVFANVTVFTVAHSATLALAWFEVVRVPSLWVETLIALSIAVIALQNVLWRGFTHRWAWAGVFGLVHGLGFYGTIGGLDLARTSVLSTMLAFNLGIEAGQVAVVGLVYLPLVYWARHAWYRPTATIGSGLILVLACWWAVDRLFVA